jgi:hypothetical protein
LLLKKREKGSKSKRKKMDKGPNKEKKREEKKDIYAVKFLFNFQNSEERSYFQV